MDYTIEISKHSIIVREGKLPKARLLGHCKELTFYYTGSRAKRMDAVGYHFMQTAIAHGYRALDCSYA